jgi:hypothetical protein
MSTRLNPNLVKIHRSYSVGEVVDLFSVHKNTVRSWVKDGLATNDSKRPMLILGSDLKQFLRSKRKRNKRKCLPYEIYCVRCRLPKLPAGNMVDYKQFNSSMGCNGQLKPDTFLDSFPIKIPFILQRGLIT